MIKIKQFYTWSILLVILLASCSKNNEISPEINLVSGEKELVLGSAKNSSVVVDFTSNIDWTAKMNASWAVLSQSSGKAGNSSVTILAKEDNNSGEPRSAVLTIGAGNTFVEINITQEEKDVINLTQTAYDISYNGGDIVIEYSTNIPKEQIKINSLSEGIDWINIIDNEGARGLEYGSITLSVSSNESRKSRTAQFKITAVSPSDPNITIMESDVITIRQELAPVGTSSDFSKDKQVISLQKHSVGNGIPLVLLGDGFLDRDIESGYYLEVMKKAMENFFTEEPVKSLRDYFDVWTVNAVSMNNAFGTQYTTRFGCKLAGGGSTLIEGNHEKVLEYAYTVPELNSDAELSSEATCIVILNTEDYAGTCYFGFNDGATNKKINLAIGYCPMINGINDDMFRRVLCHECIGHGFAKLLDEYSYQEMGTIPASEIEQNRKVQQELEWYMNVDFVNDRNKVLWSKFLKDSRYSGQDYYGETLSIYEGACTYWKGAYRPTNESMMRSNTHGFNAPSREAIYKRIMSLAYGDGWAYDYEEFVTFDIQHLPKPTDSRGAAAEEKVYKPFARPVFTDMVIKLNH